VLLATAQPAKAEPPDCTRQHAAAMRMAQAVVRVDVCSIRAAIIPMPLLPPAPCFTLSPITDPLTRAPAPSPSPSHTQVGDIKEVVAKADRMAKEIAARKGDAAAKAAVGQVELKDVPSLDKMAGEIQEVRGGGRRRGRGCTWGCFLGRASLLCYGVGQQGSWQADVWMVQLAGGCVDGTVGVLPRPIAHIADTLDHIRPLSDSVGLTLGRTEACVYSPSLMLGTPPISHYCLCLSPCLPCIHPTRTHAPTYFKVHHADSTLTHPHTPLITHTPPPCPPPPTPHRSTMRKMMTCWTRISRRRS
jgi:hypothetical protein